MKIAIDVTPVRLDGSTGGATNLCIELIKGFAVKKRIELLLLCADWNVDYFSKFQSKSVEIIQVIGEKKIIEKSKSLLKLKKLLTKVSSTNNGKNSNSILKDNNVHLLFAPFSAPTYHEDSIPIVSIIHDIQHEYYPQFFSHEEYVHRKKFYEDICNKVQVIACVSNFTKNTFCQKYQFEQKRAFTVYNSIQNRFNEVINKNELLRWNLKHEGYIIYPANFWEHKNHKMLLQAFSMYNKLNCDSEYKLVLTGNPLEKLDYFNNIISGLEISDKVIITGYLNDEELHTLLAFSKGFIFPSLFEGFGIPIAEAMQLEKLIACSNTTSLPEVGCEGIFYFDPRKIDEIVNGIKYIINEKMTDNISQNYNLKLQEYKPEVMIDSYFNIFQKVINQEIE